MAETRKHRVEVRDELDKALHAAMGAPVRPTTPGPRDEPATTAEPDAAGGEHAASRFVTPGSTIAGFTFGQATPPRAG